MTEDTRLKLAATPAVAVPAELLEQVILAGDLSKLTAKQRVTWYLAICDRVGLNPLTKPFDYLRLDGKDVLYATKTCTDQLRQIHHVSIGAPRGEVVGGQYVVHVEARLPDGRTDSDVGVVDLENLRGATRANLIMKAVTKAKRRVTLSICGLGMLDESELETLPNAQPLAFDPASGEITEPDPRAPSSDWADKPPAVAETLKQALRATAAARDAQITEAQRRRLFKLAADRHWSKDQIKVWLLRQYGIESTTEIPPVKYDEICDRLGREAPPAIEAESPF
jgi:hypothetical protein